VALAAIPRCLLVPCSVFSNGEEPTVAKQVYITEGARHLATTGRTVSQMVLAESGIPTEDWALVGLEANLILNTGSGYRPSDAMRAAIRTYRSIGREALEKLHSPS